MAWCQTEDRSSASSIYPNIIDTTHENTSKDYEPFTDRNGNNTWDDAEPFTDQGNGIYDVGEEFVDVNSNKKRD